MNGQTAAKRYSTTKQTHSELCDGVCVRLHRCSRPRKHVVGDCDYSSDGFRRHRQLRRSCSHRENPYTHTHNTYTHRHIHTPTQHSTAQHNDGVRRDGGGVHGEGAAHITAAERSVPGRRERETKEKGGGPGSTAVSDANAAHCRRRCGCRRCRHLTQTTATTKSLNLAGKQAGNNGHPPTRTTSHVRQAAQSGGKSGFCSPHSGPRHAVTAAPTMPPHA